MELRVLRYFIAVAAEGSITAAAEKLHVTQPTLSKQLSQLEEKLGTVLFDRGYKHIRLTEDGLFFLKRAQEIVDLAEKTASSLRSKERTVSGNIYIGTVEMAFLDTISLAVKQTRSQYPGIHFHWNYGDVTDSTARLERGFIDFALIAGPYDEKKYNSIFFPRQNRWGIIVSRHNPLANKSRIRPQDLRDVELLVTRQTANSSNFEGWLGYPLSKLKIIGTFDTAHIVLPLVEQNICACIIMERPNRKDWGSDLRFISFDPPILLTNNLLWNKNQPLSEAASCFLSAVKALIEEESK